jgi:hypothetical protein
MIDYLLCGKILFLNSFCVNINIMNNKPYIQYNYLVGSFSKNKTYNTLNMLEDNNILFNLPNDTEQIIISKVFINDYTLIKKFNEYFSNLPSSINKIIIFDLDLHFDDINKLINYDKEELKTNLILRKQIKKELINLLFPRLPYNCKVKINKSFIN